MAHSGSSKPILFLALLTLIIQSSLAHAQPWLEQSSADEKSMEAIRKIRSLVTQTIDRKPFQEPMPLAKFLETLEKQLPKNKKVALRIDDKAFGDKRAEVAATLVRLPPYPKKITLATVLRLRISQVKNGPAYRIDPTAIMITTPQAPQPLYTAVHDIHDLVAKQETWIPVGNNNILTSGTAINADRIVRDIVSSIDPESWNHAIAGHGSIDMVNGTRLVIRATANRQAAIKELLWSLRRLGDIAVRLQARLYEVDDAFYAKLKNAKRIDREELEKQFLTGTLPKDELFELLPKQKMVLAGDDITIDSGKEIGFLSHHQIVACLVSPEQYRRGKTNLQTIPEGVSFLASVKVSSDRRYVWIQFSEKATQLEQILQEKMLADNEGTTALAEIPLVKKATHLRLLEIPDGGTILVPVNHRSKSLQEKNRWWVLSITPRIIIAEEERNIQEAMLPPILAGTFSGTEWCADSSARSASRHWAVQGLRKPSLPATMAIGRCQGKCPRLSTALFTTPEKVPLGGYSEKRKA